MNESRINEYVQRFQEHRPAKPARCVLCRRRNGLRWHGHYIRSVIAQAQTYLVPIRRLLCTFCHHTFALMPSFVAKFHRYAKDLIRTALTWLKSHTYDATADFLVNHLMTGHEQTLATMTLHQWRRKFKTRRL